MPASNNWDAAASAYQLTEVPLTLDTEMVAALSPKILAFVAVSVGKLFIVTVTGTRGPSQVTPLTVTLADT